MNLYKALEIVAKRYGLLHCYVSESGKIAYVVEARSELQQIREVLLPENGIAIFAPEVISLASGRTTVALLVREKNPELFACQQ